MFKVMLFLHVIGAVGMGFYIVLPIMLGRATKLAGVGQGGLADGLRSANRIAQYFLVLAAANRWIFDVASGLQGGMDGHYYFAVPGNCGTRRNYFQAS